MPAAIPRWVEHRWQLAEVANEHSQCEFAQPFRASREPRRERSLIEATVAIRVKRGSGTPVGVWKCVIPTGINGPDLVLAHHTLLIEEHKPRVFHKRLQVSP